MGSFALLTGNCFSRSFRLDIHPSSSVPFIYMIQCFSMKWRNGLNFFLKEMGEKVELVVESIAISRTIWGGIKENIVNWGLKKL